MESSYKQELYRNGDAEAVLLRAMRPIGTVLAALIFAYALAGMPLPSEIPAELVAPLHLIAKVLCVGAIGILLAVWVGGHGAPKVRVSTQWVAIQGAIAIAICVPILTVLSMGAPS